MKLHVPFLPKHFLSKQAILNGLAAIALGVVMGLTVAPSPLWGLAWVGLCPLWIGAVRAFSLKQAAVVGGCWGIGYYGIVLSWLLGLHPLTWLGLSWIASLAIALLSWGIATAWCACVPLLWAVGVKAASPYLQVGTRLIVGATLWCALEGLWSQSPLWWPDLANSQSPHNLAIAHLGQLSGLTTLTFALVLVNGALAEAVLTRQKKWLGLAVLLGLMLHGLGWGIMQSKATAPLGNASLDNSLAIGLVQGNIPTRLKLSPAGVKESVSVYEQTYRDLAAQGVDAVLMPEGALPFFWGRSPVYDRTILNAIQTAQVPLWTGTFVPTQKSYTQSLIALTPQGTILGRYNKVKLVPLGEYLPFSELLKGVLQRLSPIQMGMLAGSQHQTFMTSFGQAIVGICYDSAFPELFRTQTLAGGQFILSIANNDPFNNRMLAQHHALDVLRAVESDRWLVRATNTGLSAVIAPQGQTQWKSLPKTQSTHIAHIERRTTQTLYVRYGNWLLPTLILISLGLGLIDRRSLLRQAR
jgi:apolipoprotein N-acyltransferase